MKTQDKIKNIAMRLDCICWAILAVILCAWIVGCCINKKHEVVAPEDSPQWVKREYDEYKIRVQYVLHNEHIVGYTAWEDVEPDNLISYLADLEKKKNRVVKVSVIVNHKVNWHCVNGNIDNNSTTSPTWYTFTGGSVGEGDN